MVNLKIPRNIKKVAKIIEKNDGSFITEFPEHELDPNIDLGLFWEGNLLVSTSKDIEIIYNQKRIWKEKINGVGRNKPCVCGSGKKFKKCCLNKESV